MIDDMEPADSDKHVLAHFDGVTRQYLLSILNDGLIEEHRRNPPHLSEPLSRLLAWCQRRPLVEHFAVKAEADGSFRVISFSGVRGKGPSYATEQRYTTLAEARHGVLLRHIQDLTGT